jgi:hypothetical protein
VEDEGIEGASPSVDQRRRDRLARKSAERTAEELPAATPRDQVRRGVYISWRWFSFVIVAIMTFSLMILTTQDAFYVRAIAVIYSGESQYITAPEIFQYSGVANTHFFWIDPVQVEQRLTADPQIASAQVQVGWPPSLVQITISERQPAIIWEQAGLRVWLDISGRVMALRRDLPGLVRVVVQKPSKDVHPGRCELQGMNIPLTVGSCIDQEMVNGVLQFKALYPNVAEMVYDPIKGLGFQDGRNWVLWIGSGSDISTKMLVYNAIINDATTKKRQPVEINVSDPDRPHYSFIQR